MSPRRVFAVLAALASFATPARALAQAGASDDITAISITGAESAPATKAALTGGLILLGASGAQFIHSPELWPQTWAGYGQRVADQTGFYIVQTTTYRGVTHLLGYRRDAVLCPRRELVSCAFRGTFTSFDRDGVRRANLPMLLSIAVGTGASAFWRPERADAGKTWSFVATRVGISLGGYVAERLVLDWWAQRRR